MNNLSSLQRTMVSHGWALTLAATGLFAMGSVSLLRAQVPGGLDPAFQLPVLDQGAQTLVIQPDGKALVGGSFTTYNGASVNPLLRFNADGTLDTTFAASAGILVPRENADVNALLLQADSKIVAAAYGTTTGAPTLTRLNADGTLDPGFTTTLPDGAVSALVIQPADGKIIIAGDFYTVDGTAATGLARLNADGSIDPAFQAAPAPANSSGVTLIQQGSAVLLQTDGKIVVAGTINTPAGVVPAVVRLNADGTQDTAFTPVTPDGGGSFQCLALQSGSIIVAGSFTSLSGVPVPNIARLSGVDGSLDRTFAPGLTLGEGINQLAVQADGKILTGNNVGGSPTLARLNADGSVDRDYAPGFLLNQSTVTALALQPDGLAVVSGTLILPAPQGNQPNVSVARLLANPASGLATVSVAVPGNAKVWLAPNGAVDQDGFGDTLANAGPVRATGLALTPGATLTFSATGFVNNNDGNPGSGPDGDGEFETESTQNGLSGVTAAGNALLGVFIDDSAADPTNANAPASLDFSGSSTGVPGGQDYPSLSPLLDQAFFVGSGKTSGGVTRQVTVPAGATHLVLGTVDYGLWHDNSGGFNVTVTTGAGTGAAGVPLTGTVLTLTGADLGAAVAKGTPLTFTATQGAIGAGIHVRVQATLTPTVESSWTDLPDTINGGAGYLASEGGGTYQLTTTQYPSGNVSFRAITAEQGQTDSISNVLQSYAIDIALLTVNPDDLSYTVEGQGTTNQVVPGDKIDYSLTVRNTGFEPATGLVVQATFDPVNTKLLNTKTKKVSDGGTASGSVITWNLPSLANGTHHTFTFSVKVNAGVDTQNGIHTGADVKSAGSNGGLVYINASSVPEIALLVVPAFNISVSNNGLAVDGNGAPVSGAGRPLTFTFTVTNRTAGTVSNVGVYIPLPSGYEPANFKMATLVDGNGNPIGSPFKVPAHLPDGTTDNNAVFVTIPSIAAGQFQQFTFTVNVPYTAAPGSDVTLPVLQLTGNAADGSQLSFAQANYVAQLSSQPPPTLPGLALLKIVPTAGAIQSFEAQLAASTGSAKTVETQAAAQLLATISMATGLSETALLGEAGDELLQLINPYVSRDTDLTSGHPLLDVPSPNAKQTAPYVTYALVYFNAGTGDAAGITISDTVAANLQIDPTSISVKGATLTSPGSVVGTDGHSLTFAFGKIKAGTGGLILYRALVPAPTAGGPNLGDTIAPITASLTTASLSNQIFDTPAETLLVTGKANALVDASESDPGDGTAVYNIFYQNTGGQTSKDFVVVSEVPTGGAFVSADFLDFNQNVIAGSLYPDGTKHVSATQYIEPIASGATSGQVVFHLGKVTPHGLGFVQAKYRVTPAALALNPAGLTHHYYVDGSSFPGAPAITAGHVGQPLPRVVEGGPRPRSLPTGLSGPLKLGPVNVSLASDGFFALTTLPPVVAPTVWLSRIAPLAVQEDTDFTYLVTVGNCGQTPAYKLVVAVDLPTGATFKSSTSGSFSGTTNFFMLNVDALQPGQSQSVTLTFHATAAAGSTIDSDTCTTNGFGGTSSNPVGTGSCDVGTTSSFVYSASQAATFDTLKTSIVTNATRAAGGDPVALAGGALYPSHLANVTPQSTQTTIAHADFISLTNGATIVPQGGGNIVSQGGGNIVSQGGGNIVSQGGGNVVAQGGNIVLNDVTGFSGSITVADLLSANGLEIVAQGGGNIVSQGGGNIVSQGGGNILDFQTGASLISTSALPFNFVAVAGLGNVRSEGLIGEDGSSVISNDGGSLIGNDGSSLISQDGGGLYGNGGASLLGTGGVGGNAQRLGSVPVRRAAGVPAGVTLGSPTDSIHVDFNDAGSLVFGVGGKQLSSQSGGN